MYFALKQVHGEVANHKASRFGSLRRTANQRLDTSEQFRKCKRFREVIIATRLQAANAVIDSRFSAENEDRRADVFVAHFANRAETVELRKHDVDDGGIVGNGLGANQPLFSIAAMVHGKAALLEAVDYERGDFWVILDDQDAHGREHREGRKPWEIQNRRLKEIRNSKFKIRNNFQIRNSKFEI